MTTNTNGYCGYRFPREIISHGVWPYHRFSLSLRDVEELLAKRGITVTYETIRQWCRKFGPEYARKLKRRQGRLGDVWHLDEVYVKIGGERHDLWRAVAGRGSGRRRDRHSGSAISQRPCGQTVLSQATEKPGKRAVDAGDGQVEELRCAPSHRRVSQASTTSKDSTAARYPTRRPRHKTE